VDLGGFTDDARPGIFARRAAPLQVSYLGYLGTLGAPYMDYLIADATLVPAAARGFYAEKLLYLPSYQANDSQRPIAERTPSRAEVGLPEDGVVFCCFNANYKITPTTFDGWMRILAQVHGSSLLLLGGHPAAADNLRREAGARGIDPKRLVFGPPLPPAEYRARYRIADLFLDTLPYNAGTTASDALWAGTPVLTCPGEAFASRMAASLLESVGLPELIARDAADYERRAVKLAANPDQLAALKAKLAHQRRIAPLFDSVRFARTLEDGYTQIHDRHLAGLPPDHVEVADSAPLLTPAPAAASAR
jgi:predicted O-linked N-acetylglucosamine transferase (SPINDLY family)